MAGNAVQSSLMASGPSDLADRHRTDLSREELAAGHPRGHGDTTCWNRTIQRDLSPGQVAVLAHLDAVTFGEAQALRLLRV